MKLLKKKQKFDVVTDADIQRPDTTGYVMYDENTFQ